MSLKSSSAVSTGASSSPEQRGGQAVSIRSHFAHIDVQHARRIDRSIATLKLRATFADAPPRLSALVWAFRTSEGVTEIGIRDTPAAVLSLAHRESPCSAAPRSDRRSSQRHGGLCRQTRRGRTRRRTSGISPSRSPLPPPEGVVVAPLDSPSHLSGFRLRGFLR